MSTNNGFLIKTVFWVLILACFAFSAGSYAFTWTGALQIKDAIVCNDRLRQDGDEKIKDNVEKKLDIIQKDMTELKVMVATLTANYEKK